MIVNYCFNLAILITNSIFLKKFLHIYQLKDYNNFRYLNYFKNKKSLIFIFTLILLFLEIFFKNIIFYCVFNVILYIFYIIYLKFLIKQNKTPIKYTNKLKHIYYISIAILIITSLYKYAFCLVIIITTLTPIVANFLNVYDKILNLKFIKQAQIKLKNSKTKIIAITGSNGKTSVKNILYEMISTKYQTQCTPASYNTPLGISKFINNQLKYNTEFLILEYGARHKNDIKKLCNIFGADYGIVTTISGQHLQTFKTTENIYIAKSELPEFLQNKLCVFNIDNIYCKRMHKFKTGKNLTASIYEKADIYAKNIKIENYKTNFELIINNRTYKTETNLLGRHNIINICLASALAKELNITNKNIIETIKNLKQTEHRLSLIKTHINILDDSYNCSPASSTEAIWTLSHFPNKKMVATPGIIEGGKNEYNINYELGKNLALADFIIIIGTHNKKAILEGLKSQNYLETNIHFAPTLNDATQYFKLLNKNDTLLLLNDLPDDYN